MTYATVHLHLTPYPEPTSVGAIDYACALAKLFEAKLVVSSSHLEIRAPQNWVEGAMMSTMARELQTITTARTEALELHVQRGALLQGISVKVSHTAEHWPGGLVDNAWRGRVSDLCILSLSPDSAEPHLNVEDWLFGSGRPCILYPDSSKQPFSAENVMVCWDFSKSAARTVSDALPLLHNSKRVRVTVFRGEKDIPVADPTTPLLAFLAEHGVKVEAEDVVIGGRTIGAAILDHARATDTNLIMMGAFGHSRLREFLLGGATRELLAKSSIPLFMSH
jgi:nucleotide-binding universal stress UspA family protein